MGHGTRESKSKRAIWTESSEGYADGLGCHPDLRTNSPMHAMACCDSRRMGAKCCHTCGMPSPASNSAETPAAWAPSDHADPFVMHGWCVSHAYRALGPNRKRALPYRVARAADHSSPALDPSVGHHRRQVYKLCAFVPLHSADLDVQDPNRSQTI